ncbi:MAG: MATE family efflux transporter [Oscillospiraceae bacterium]|jgi:putative MATE family efflux protein|nr:MATE family efflux transporter [Oscillospiraceae bacterium]
MFKSKPEIRKENKEIFRLFWPVFIEQTLAVTIGMVSAMMVSGVGDFAVSGVNLVETFNFTIISIFHAIAVGATVIVAQKIGASKMSDAGETAYQSIVFCVITATLLGGLVMLGSRQILDVIYGAAADNVLEAGATYFWFSGISYPFLGLFAACSGVMRAGGNSRTPMIASVIANILNISLAFILIRLGYGVLGVSVAMLCARIMSGVFSLIMLRKGTTGFVLAKGLPRMTSDILRPVLRVGIPSGIDAMFFNGARVVMTVFMSGMGTVALHAHAIGNSLSGFIFLPGNAFAIVSVTIIGQAYGARLFRKVQRLMKKMCVFASLSILLIVIILFLILDPLISLYSPSVEAAALVRRLVLMFGTLAPFLWSFAFCIPQMLRACGDAKFTMYISVFSLLALRVFGSWLFGIYFDLGTIGVWMGMFADWVGRAIGFGLRAFTNAWCKNKIPAD